MPAAPRRRTRIRIAPPEVQVRPFTVRDHARAVRVWRACGPGVGLVPDDRREPLGRFLARNPGLSQVALRGRRMIGAVLVGHDGRRATVYHLGVIPAAQGQGIGRLLMARVLAALGPTGVGKCNLLVYATNRRARRFYARQGWRERTDLLLLQHPIP